MLLNSGVPWLLYLAQNNLQKKRNLFHNIDCTLTNKKYLRKRKSQLTSPVGNACLQESIPHKCHKGKGIIQGKLHSQVH